MCSHNLEQMHDFHPSLKQNISHFPLQGEELHTMKLVQTEEIAPGGKPLLLVCIIWMINLQIASS